MKYCMLLIINLYQKLVSPFLGRQCRFYPTCSNYAKEAIIKRGVIVGAAITVWRILRCNPFCQGGYDPVMNKNK
ncbi:MAG: membrane protein insertion efficiency factor YidD [Candidatus Jidaibacter sp.]|nr:membrane protein insertion efficiency factor YidD [Candidatus Jidaibacter sp.]